jgi:hypothetical protein
MKRFSFFILAIGCLTSFTDEDDFVNSIKQRADNYFAKNSGVKLELLFDQPQYVSGDTARFKTSYLKATNLQPVDGTQIVHVCLFDQDGKKKLSRWFSVTNGFAANSLSIPENLLPGTYVLVGFTDWMKNFSQELFFKQEFVVSGKNLFVREQPSDTLEFYPEGGRLIEGVENNIAVRYKGSRPKVTASILESGSQIATVEVRNDSVSTFRLTPKSTTYSAETAGKKFALPSINNKGVSLRVEIADRIKLNLEKAGDDTQNLYLLVVNRSGLIFQNKLDLKARERREVLLPQNLPMGVAQVAIVDSQFKLVAARSIYIQRQTANVTISNPQEFYSTRKPISVTVRAKDDGYSFNGSFSCRVLKDELFQQHERTMEYFTFQSDISNTASLRKTESAIVVSNFLITQSCPWFDWERISRKETYLPLIKSNQHLVLSGKATHAKNGSPAADSTLLMFYLEKNLVGYEAIVNSKGNFSFPMFLNVRSQDRFLYAASRRGNDLDDIIVKINDPDSLITFKAPRFVQQTEAAGDAYFTYSAQKKAIDKSYSFFYNQKPAYDSIGDPNKAMEDELNGVDATVRLSDYLQLPTMTEVLKEVVKSVDYRKINGRHVVRVYTTGKKPTNYTGPLYVIDGQLTKDPSQFLNLLPSDVLTIKLVKDSRKLFALGHLGANGVIIVRTKKQVKIQEKNRLDFSGLLPEFADRRNDKNIQTPDFRSNLYWSPKTQLNSEANIQFTSSDDVGRYMVQIYGMTEKGEPFFAEKPIELKYTGN